MKRFFSSGLNVLFLVVVVLTLVGAINYLAAWLILVLSVLFYIEDHLRTLVILKKQETADGTQSQDQVR